MIFENSYIDLDKTAHSGQCFRWQLNKKEPDVWSVPVGGYIAKVRRIDESHIEVNSELEDEGFWSAYFDLERDYESMFAHLYEHAPDALKTAYSSSYGIVILNQPFFETCISFLISQNNNIPRIEKIIENICGGKNEAFPDACKLINVLNSKDVRLGYRQAYLENFCRMWMEGKLRSLEELSPLEHETIEIGRDTAKIIECLQEFKGIGPKVAACIALFSLGCIDCVPKDVWIKRAEQEYKIQWDSQWAGYQQQLIFFWQQNCK